MPDLSVEASLPKVRKSTLLSFYQNCAYYPGAKAGKKYVLNKQYALLSQWRLLARVYGIPQCMLCTCACSFESLQVKWSVKFHNS